MENIDKNLLVFSRNFPYILGGAEKSLFEEIRKEKFKKINVTYAKQDVDNLLDLSSLNCDFESKPIQEFSLFGRFFYYEYVRNRSLVSEVIRRENFDILFSQNRWAPIAIKSALIKGKPTRYYLRDETSLGIMENYYNGINKLAKDAYRFFELPAIKVFDKDNEFAIKNSTEVISNSEFIAEQVWNKFKTDSKVVLPFIDSSSLINDYNFFTGLKKSSKLGVVIIGDTKIKGIDIFLDLAEAYPKENFYIFGKSRNRSFSSKYKNVFHLGWRDNCAEVYAHAKVVLVPSVWNEAFGRVAVEATTLGIPVIVSNRGGLPEAVNYDKNLIANNFSDFKDKLRKVI